MRLSKAARIFVGFLVLTGLVVYAIYTNILTVRKGRLSSILNLSSDIFNNIRQEYLFRKKQSVALNLKHGNGVKQLGTTVYDTINASFKVLYSISAMDKQIASIQMTASKGLNLGRGPCKRKLPQCIIIGNFKSGTRELIDFMSMHPKIKIRNKPTYELSFFDRRYQYGLSWYKHHMPCSYNYQVTVEKSPSYYHSKEAPARMHKMNSSIKLIALVREPVSRAISHFTFSKNRLRHYNYNLDNCVIGKRTGEINTNCEVVKESVYDKGMKRYLSYFNRSQIKVFETDEFKRNPYAILRDIEQFLNLEHSIKPENFVFNREKEYYCLRQNRTSATASCYGKVRGRNLTELKNSLKMSTDTLKKLKSFFKPHNDRFFRLINKTFDW